MSAIKKRIAVLNSHPIQYFAPMYAYLNASDALEIIVLYCSDFSLRDGSDPGFELSITWDVDLLSGYEARFLGEKSKSRVPGGFWSLVCPEVYREILSGGYVAIIIHGHSFFVNFLALAAAKIGGTKVFMRGETHLGLNRSALKRFFRKPLMKLLYSFCDRCLAIGTENAVFYRSMGVEEDRIVLVPYAVDNHRFIAESSLDFDARIQVFSKYGVPANKPVILFASKLQKRKHPDDLIRAIKKLCDQGVECNLLIVGSGEMYTSLKKLVEDLELTNVFFTGFVNQSELPSIYGASDIFVLPAENEPWGLVVNEVMCAALPIVISREVGCVSDLVKDGYNGFTFNAGDVNELTGLLRSLILDPALRKRLGEHSLELISQWSYAECLQGIEAALLPLKKNISRVDND